MTLHRWVGTREQLLAEVLWVGAERALSRLRQQVRAEDRPGSHAAEMLGRWGAEVLEHPGVRQLQAEEGEMFARLVTSNRSDFQRRLIDSVRELLAEDVRRGTVTIDLDPAELACATVRIVASFIHTPAITGETADSERNARVLRAMLR